MQRVIIGCGNVDRGDDAAGILVARRLRELGLDAREHSGDGLALIEAWTGAERVILVDTVVTGAAPGTISACFGTDAPVLDAVVRTSTHAFGAGEAIRLARVLNRLPAWMKIWGIEGNVFTPGVKPSRKVLESVEQVANRIAEDVRRQP